MTMDKHGAQRPCMRLHVCVRPFIRACMRVPVCACVACVSAMMDMHSVRRGMQPWQQFTPCTHVAFACIRNGFSSGRMVPAVVVILADGAENEDVVIKVETCPPHLALLP